MWQLYCHVIWQTAYDKFCADICRVDLITHKVDELMESSFLTANNNSSSTTGGPNQQPRLPPVLDDRLNYLQEQVSAQCVRAGVYVRVHMCVHIYFHP